MTRKLATVLGVAAVAVVAAWFFLLWKPQTHKLDAIHAKERAQQTQIATLRAALVSLQQQKRDQAVEKAALDQLTALVPNSPDLSTALKELYTAAAASGVQVTSVSPTPPASYGTNGAPTAAGTAASAQPLPLSIAASGTYAQDKAFIVDLDRLPRLFVIQTIQISGNAAPTGAAQILNLTLTADMFYQPAAG
ncbi:MAG: type IV pilus inner membrane component PilO [Acidimicrobiales bacterium]